MDKLAPVGDVYQAGTLSGNPLSVAAGIATLSELADPSIYEEVNRYATQLAARLAELFAQHSVPVQINMVGSLLTLFFSDKPVTDFESAKQADMQLYARFFHSLLEQGIFLPPSGFEAWFVSVAHGEEGMELTVKAVGEFLKGT
jgi:glutamate-1-semialdehyde 2,1-aminomutase